MTTYHPKIARTPSMTRVTRHPAPALALGPRVAALTQLQAQVAGSLSVRQLQSLQREVSGAVPRLPGIGAPLQKVSGKGLLKRIGGGFGAGSVAAGIGGGLAGYGLASGLALASPVGLGLAALLGTTALTSYLLGPVEGTIFNTDFGDEDADDDYEPIPEFMRRRQDILDDPYERTPAEAEIRGWDGATSVRTNLGPGHISYRPGWGGQAFVQSRGSDYGGVGMGLDYDSIARELDSGTDEEIEERGYQLLQAALGKAADFAGWSQGMLRAGGHLLGITQLAEEHESRNPGAALLARGALTAVADGTRTFREAFGRTVGTYPPAHIGGTGEMRRVLRREVDVDELTAGLAAEQ